MAKPWIHAQSSARKFGGKPEDYIEIHDLMDSSKSVIPDNRHRALTHNSWFIFIVEKIFGHNIEISATVKCPNCDGTGYLSGNVALYCEQCRADGTVPGTVPKLASVRAVVEQHILEDFGNKWIPSAQDYLEGMEFQGWMNNGVEGCPTSHRKIQEGIRRKKTTKRTLELSLLD